MQSAHIKGFSKLFTACLFAPGSLERQMIEIGFHITKRKLDSTEKQKEKKQGKKNIGRIRTS